ncbi:hypothetical protein ACFX16_008913 [Malus domestica]
MNLPATSPIVNGGIVLDQLSCDIQTPETNILPQRKQFKIYTPPEFIDPLPTWIYREEFLEAIRTYITGQTDVNTDENYGYRVISMVLGIDNGWCKGRVDQFKQLQRLDNVATNDMVDLEDD